MNNNKMSGDMGSVPDQTDPKNCNGALEVCYVNALYKFTFDI